MLSAPGVGKKHSLTTWFVFVFSCPCFVVEGRLVRNRIRGKRYFCGRFPLARLDGFGAICCKDADLGALCACVQAAHALSVEVPVPACLWEHILGSCS